MPPAANRETITRSGPPPGAGATAGLRLAMPGAGELSFECAAASRRRAEIHVTFRPNAGPGSRERRMRFSGVLDAAFGMQWSLAGIGPEGDDGYFPQGSVEACLRFLETLPERDGEMFLAQVAAAAGRETSDYALVLSNSALSVAAIREHIAFAPSQEKKDRLAQNLAIYEAKMAEFEALRGPRIAALEQVVEAARAWVSDDAVSRQPWTEACQTALEAVDSHRMPSPSF